MPNRAKLTTRGISTTTVTTETLPKNASLTNNELDSNFINLRDQTFSIVGDDSSGIDIKAGDTIKFTGAGGATITASGDTITVTAGGGGGGGSTGDLTIIGSTISGPSNADINLTAGGTGNINLNADTVRLGDSATNAILTTNGAGDLILSTNDNTSTASIRIYDGNPGAIELNSFGGANIGLNAGVGNIAIGSGSAEPGGITTQSTYDLHLNTNNNTTSANITIENNTGGGTGKIHLNPYGSDDYVFIGSGGKDGTDIARLKGGTGLYFSDNTSGQTLSLNYEGGITIDTNDSGYLYIDAGTRYAGVTTSVQSASDPTVTIDASKTTVTSVILNADAQIRIDNLTYSYGAFHRIYLQQDGTGGRTASFSLTDSSAIKWPYGPPVLSTDAYAIDMVELHSFQNSGPPGDPSGEVVGVFTKGFTASYGSVDTVSYNNQNIRLLPNGSGNVILDLHTWPNTDGSNGQVLTTNGAGVLSWTTVSSGGSLTFVGDDSTGTAVSINETFKIAGTQNITTAVSGDTLTITGPNLSSYLTNSPITIVGDDSTGTTLNTGETLKIAGGTGITTAVSGDVLTITATGGGSGAITFVGDDSTGTAVNTGETLKIAGGTGITTAVSGDVLTITATGGGGSTGDLAITGTTISAGTTNADITVTSSGTGNFNVDMDTVRIGDANANATITTNGTGDLILSTNSGSNSGSITIADGINQDITIATSGSGNVILQSPTGQVGFNYGGTTRYFPTFSSPGLLKFDGTNMSWAGLSLPSILPTDIDIVGSTITAGTTNGDITITSTGTGNLNVDMDTLRVGDSATTATITTNGAGDLVLNTNSGSNSGNITITQGTNGNISITPNGTGDVYLTADTVVVGDSASTATITTNGLGDLVLNTNSGTSSGEIKIYNNANANIEITPNGTGDVYLNTDTVRVGDSNADATITTNGTGDLILNTNSGSSSGVIKIADGSAGKISIIPNTTGRVDLGHEAETTTNFPTAVGSLGAFEVTDNRIRGTGKFYSNLTYAPYTATTDQVIAGNSYAMIKTNGGSFNSANIRNVASANQMVFDLNGGSATATTTNVTSTGVGPQVNLNYYMNTAGGTKTGLNAVTNRNFTQIVAGHGGALTIPRVVGVLNDLGFARNTGDTTTITEAWGFRDQGITYSGTGTTGTNSIVTDYTAFETGVNTPSSTNTPWAFRVRTAGQNWRSRIGAVDLPQRWSSTTTHSSGSAYTVDFSSTGNGFRQVTLSSNITSFTMSNFPTSTTVISEFDIVFIQDGTGGRTISFTPTSTEVFKFRNGTSTLSDSTAAPEVLHAKVFVRYDGTKSIYYWDIDNREYI